MLVLSRLRDEIIVLDFAKMSDEALLALRGQTIEFATVDLRGDKVRLGITAPKDVAVHRKEVYDAIQRENRAAAQVGSGTANAGTPGTAPAEMATDDQVKR